MTFPLPNLSTDLTGRVALVTGASSGLGWRFAKVLASQGAKVALIGRRLERLEALAAEIKADGGEAAAFAVDVADAEALIAMVSQVEERLGLVDILVNIASVAAFQYRGGGAALYSVTKAGVIRMTEALAVEWAPFNINVNAIAPGAFASEMMDGMLARVGDITKGFPRPRIGDPAQMDSTLIYLVSPASDFVTGTFIKIDDAQGGR